MLSAAAVYDNYNGMYKSVNNPSFITLILLNSEILYSTVATQ